MIRGDSRHRANYRKFETLPTGTSEVVPHGFAIESGLTGEFANVDPSCRLFLFTSEILEHEIILRVDHAASTRYSVVPDGAMLFR
ncbi:hypothetical protein FGU65_02900 [Methanoculleus sp. FWC-SCC1]|uniref:Uncharacterized protein n=1 Tax=Methanoculleus frigidifontis TaxID=2584085 RepID=A0ABT8M7D8_9EURY|nr:hypothetical protein [Methanoculleus sp. FWC-SCC1]MDN7023849.1 hypothetical protein [Methanoculleus sp. FWC-SCC1]